MIDSSHSGKNYKSSFLVISGDVCFYICVRMVQVLVYSYNFKLVILHREFMSRCWMTSWWSLNFACEITILDSRKKNYLNQTSWVEVYSALRGRIVFIFSHLNAKLD